MWIVTSELLDWDDEVNPEIRMISFNSLTVASEAPMTVPETLIGVPMTVMLCPLLTGRW